MIDRDEALRIARTAIAGAVPDGTDVVLLDDAIQEHPFGWVVFYQSRAFVETHEPTTALMGNAPLIVDRADGSTRFIATGEPVAAAVERYGRERPGSPSA